MGSAPPSNTFNFDASQSDFVEGRKTKLQLNFKCRHHMICAHSVMLAQISNLAQVTKDKHKVQVHIVLNSKFSKLLCEGTLAMM